MAKQKLRWDFPPLHEIHEELIFIDPKSQRLLPAPLVVRNCYHGYDEQGILRKVLYCSRDGRFFVHYPDGWHELMPLMGHMRKKQAAGKINSTSGGGSDCPQMRDYGSVFCHRAVAYVWCKWPEAAKKDPEWYKYGCGFEVDHKNCAHGNFSAENLEWVTEPENKRRRYKVEEPLKKLGITKISWIEIPLLDCLYAFHEVQLEYFFEQLPKLMAESSDDLTIENINRAISDAIDETILCTIRCDRCGCLMMVDTEESYTRYGILCDCCYGDLYG